MTLIKNIRIVITLVSPAAVFLTISARDLSELYKKNNDRVVNFSENLRHIRQRDFIKFEIIPLRLLHNLILLVKSSKRRVFLDKVL